MSKQYSKTNRVANLTGVEMDDPGERAFWNCDGEVMVLRDESNGTPRNFDLVERTAKFGEMVIRFAKRVSRNPVNTPLISQLVRAGTSVGANYCEADDAVSKKDFKYKVGTCRKEAKETKHWLRMVATAEESLKNEARTVWREARELHLIFCSIFNRS